MATDLHARRLGERVLRLEDPKLLTGQGRYLDDLSLPGMVWMTVVRSPLAHARINSIDTAAAMALPGVVAEVLLVPTAAGETLVLPVAASERLP